VLKNSSFSNIYKTSYLFLVQCLEYLLYCFIWTIGNGFDDRSCISYRNRNFKERLIIEMNKENKSNSKYEKKCICSNNKNKITKGRYNSVTKETKVE